MRPDGFGTSTKLVTISLVFKWDGGSGMGGTCYLVSNESTYEGDPIWNRTVPVSNQSCVHRVDLYLSGFDPKRI